MSFTEEPIWTQSNRLMWSFDYDRRLAAWIWAARLRTCPICDQPPHSPCLNLTDVKRLDLGKIGWEGVRYNKWPHSQRVDWVKLFNTLYERGYRPEPAARKAARLAYRESRNP